MLDNRTIFLVVSGWALLITGLFAVVMMLGGPIRAFVRARLMNKDVIEIMTTSGKKIFTNQKSEVSGVYELTNDKAVEVDPNSFYTGPGGVRMTTCQPEIPVTYNPRKLTEGFGLGLDMMTLKTYGIKHEQMQWEKSKTGKEWLAPFGMIIIILLAVSFTLGPFFYNKMMDMNEAGEWRQKYDTCRVEMFEAGVMPEDTQKTSTDKTKPKLDTTSLKKNEATTGASIK